MNQDRHRELLVQVARDVGFTGNLDFMGRDLVEGLSFRDILRIGVMLGAFYSGLEEGAFAAGREHGLQHICINKDEVSKWDKVIRSRLQTTVDETN